MYLLAPLGAPRDPAGTFAAPAEASRGRPKTTAPPPKTPSAPPQGRCATPQGEAIPAQKILKDLSEGTDVDLVARVIEGSLDADLLGPLPDGRKSLLRVLRGKLRLDSCRILGRVSLPHTVLMQGLELTCSEIQGDLDLRDSDVLGAVAADRCRIMGDLRLARTSVEGDVKLKGMVLDRSLELSEANIHALMLTGARVLGGVDFSRSVATLVNLNAMRVDGDTKLEDVLILTALSGRQASFGQGLTVDAVRVKGTVSLDGAGGGGPFSISDLSVDTNLVLPLALEGSLGLTDVNVRQNLNLIGGRFGEVTISRLSVGGSSELRNARFTKKVVIADTDFGGAFLATDAVFEGETEFRKVRLAGKDPMQGARFMRAPVLVETTLPRPPTVVLSEEDEAEEPEQDSGSLDGKPD